MNAFGSLMATINGYERQTSEVKVSTGVIVKFPKDWQERNGRGKNISIPPPKFNLKGVQVPEVPISGKGAGRKYQLFTGNKT